MIPLLAVCHADFRYEVPALNFDNTELRQVMVRVMVRVRGLVLVLGFVLGLGVRVRLGLGLGCRSSVLSKFSAGTQV